MIILYSYIICIRARALHVDKTRFQNVSFTRIILCRYVQYCILYIYNIDKGTFCRHLLLHTFRNSTPIFVPINRLPCTSFVRLISYYCDRSSCYIQQKCWYCVRANSLNICRMHCVRITLQYYNILQYNVGRYLLYKR